MANEAEAKAAGASTPLSRLSSRILSCSRGVLGTGSMDLCDVLLPAFRTIVDSATPAKKSSGLGSRVKGKLKTKDSASLNQRLSIHDVQVAKDCVVALKVLKRISDKAGALCYASNAFSETGASEGDHVATPTITPHKEACLRWSAGGLILSPDDAQALLAPLLSACRGPRPGASGKRASQQTAKKKVQEGSSFASLSLQCLQLLVSQRLLEGSGVQDTLVGKALEAIVSCYAHRAVMQKDLDKREDLESDVIQALVIFCSSPVLKIHGYQLARSFRILLHIQRYSTSSANRCLAKAAASQLIQLAALKTEAASHLADPAGACTPITLLPWSSSRMPLGETMKVVHQCMSHLMGEVAFPGEDHAEARKTGKPAACDIGKKGDCFDLGTERSGEEPAYSCNGVALEDLTSQLEDIVNTSGRMSSASSRKDLGLEDGGEEMVNSSQLLEAASLSTEHVTGDESTASEQRGAESEAVTEALPPLLMSPVATCDSVLMAGHGLDGSRESTTQGADSCCKREEGACVLDVKSVESQLSVVQWSRTDSCGSAATSSSNNSNNSSSGHGAFKQEEQTGPSRHVGPSRAEKPSSLQALALEGPPCYEVQAQLLPDDVSTGNLEAMDKLFVGRAFSVEPEAGCCRFCQATVGEENGFMDGPPAASCCATSSSIQPEDLEKHDDVLLLTELMCSVLSGEGKGNAARFLPSDAAGRVNIMEQLLWLLDCCGPQLVHCKRMAGILGDQLCPALLGLWALADPAMFGLCYSVLLRLATLFQHPVLPCLRLLLPHMLLRPLEEPMGTHSRATWHALHLLSCLARQPHILLGLYANLDCSLGTGSIIERSVSALSRCASPSGALPVGAKRSAGEVLFSVLSGLREWSGVKLAQAGAAQVASAWQQDPLAKEQDWNVQIEECCEADGSPQPSLAKEVEARGDASTCLLDNSCGRPTQACKEEPLRKRLEARELFQEGSSAFCAGDSQEGLETLCRAHEAATGEARSKGRVLFQYAQSLREEAIGELLGRRDAQSLLSEFLECFDFKDIPIDGALRLLLTTFRPPGEAQKIDRIMEAFAARFWECNACTAHKKPLEAAGDSRAPVEAVAGGPAAGPDAGQAECGCSAVAPFKGCAATAHVLAFSIIMLHTDAHSPAVKAKMSKADFIRNNRGLDAGEDLPEGLLSSLYDRILGEEMRSLRGREGAQAGQLAVTRKPSLYSGGMLGSRKLTKRKSLPIRRASTVRSSSKEAATAYATPTPRGGVPTSASPTPRVCTSTWGSPRLHDSTSPGSGGWSASRMHRKMSFLAGVGKNHSLRSSAPALVPANPGRPHAESLLSRQPTTDIDRLEATEGEQPAVPPLWGPWSPQPFSQFPELAVSTKAASSSFNGGETSKHHTLAAPGTQLRHEVQRLSLSPRGSLAAGLSDLPVLAGEAAEASWRAPERRRWALAMASGVCQDRYYTVQHLDYPQALFSALAPGLRKLLRNSLNPRWDVFCEEPDTPASSASSGGALTRSLSANAGSSRATGPGVVPGLRLALLHAAMDLSSTLRCPELLEAFQEILAQIKSSGSTGTIACRLPSPGPKVPPLQHLPKQAGQHRPSASPYPKKLFELLS